MCISVSVLVLILNKSTRCTIVFLQMFQQCEIPLAISG